MVNSRDQSRENWGGKNKKKRKEKGEEEETRGEGAEKTKKIEKMRKF